MTLAIYFGALLVLLGAMLMLRHWRDSRQTAPQIEAGLRAVDVECFEALSRSLDARCITYLPPGQARAIRRRLALGAFEYLWRVHHNANLYTQLGQLAARAADVELATAGRELAQQAVMARMQSTSALFRTATMLLFPGRQVSGAWIPLYQGVAKPLARVQALYAGQAA